MSSLRNRRPRGGVGNTATARPVEHPDDALLDAARASIVAVGWKRSTLTDVARRAGVSRMTIYRSWPDMQTLLGDLMTREWSGLVESRDRTQDGLLALLEAMVAEGQHDGSVRDGDPVLLARSALLATYGFALSVP